MLVLSASLADSRFRNALRALNPRAVVLCGGEASLDVIGGPLRTILAGEPKAPVVGYRTARLVSGNRGMATLGDSPDEATAALLDSIESAARATA